MPSKRKLSAMVEPQLSEEPPAMSTRSKRARTIPPPQPQQHQSQSIASSIEIEELHDIVTATVTSATKRSRHSKRTNAMAAEQFMPSPTLTPSLTPAPEVSPSLKTRTLRERNTTKKSSPLSAIPDSNDTPPQGEQQQQHTLKQKMARKRTAAKAFSDSDLAPSLTLPQVEQHEPYTKKRKTTLKRTTAKSQSPLSVVQDVNTHPAPSLPPVQSARQKPRVTKQTMTQKRSAKVTTASSPHATLEPEDAALLSPAGHVVKFWMDQCRKVFPEHDGYEVTIHSIGDTGDQSKQQVIVWEKEFYDEAMLLRPSPKIPESKFDPTEEYKLPAPSLKSADGTRWWAEDDCDFLQLGVIQPPATMKEYTRAAKKLGTKFELRDVPILVIECRGADADHDGEWHNPGAPSISRSYSARPQSQIQKALIDNIYTFDDVKVKYEPAKGWLTQEQCFCATAIGDKIKFWKHVSPYPHLKPWSGILSKGNDGEKFSEIVSRKLAEVKEDGFEFAMEWDGRKTFANA
ncbi:hypothetical protein FKW77_004236 [Venturia effusa]|uniref:Uncharacterized protein n=1 Tax=Venturia effusa TaxID=50376 RepID=A0A517L932_9PEZI|nr:hypothetical protein FKW77_004236 [Venturia effusa]